MTMFTGSEGENFSLDTAAGWTSNYRSANPDGITAEVFGKTILSSILSQTNCVGIRIYYALDDNGVQKLILVGVNSAGYDMTSGIVAERGFLCPPYCDANSSPLKG